MRRDLLGVGLWIDTAELTPEETVDSILANENDAVIRARESNR